MDINPEVNQSPENPQPETLTAALYECWPGGPIVSNPADCGERDTWRNTDTPSLPNLEITGLASSTPEISTPTSSSDTELARLQGECGASDWRCLEKAQGGRVLS